MELKSQTIDKIMNKNWPNGYGYVSFLLPYFDKFVEQQMILEDF